MWPYYGPCLRTWWSKLGSHPISGLCLPLDLMFDFEDYCVALMLSSAIATIAVRLRQRCPHFTLGSDFLHSLLLVDFERLPVFIIFYSFTYLDDGLA